MFRNHQNLILETFNNKVNNVKNDIVSFGTSDIPLWQNMLEFPAQFCTVNTCHFMKDVSQNDIVLAPPLIFARSHCFKCYKIELTLMMARPHFPHLGARYCSKSRSQKSCPSSSTKPTPIRWH